MHLVAPARAGDAMSDRHRALEDPGPLTQRIDGQAHLHAEAVRERLHGVEQLTREASLAR